MMPEGRQGQRKRHGDWRPVYVWWVMLFAGTATVWGQTSIVDQVNPLGRRQEGLKINGVSVFSAYSSGGTPVGISLPFSALADPTVYMGTSASVGWVRSGHRASTLIYYSPTYVRSMRGPKFSTVNHSLSVDWNTDLAAKWSLGASAAGFISNLDQALFAPTRAGSAVALSTGFDEFAAAALTGSSQSFELSSILHGAQVMSSPEQSFVYGDRILSASGQVTVRYAPSQRSSIYASVFATRAQPLKESSASREPAMRNLTNTTSGGVNGGWSYSMTPRTQIGVDFTITRMLSIFQDAYNTRTAVSLGRTMSKNWFAQGSLGVGRLIHTREASFGPRRADYVAGATLGYKTRAHTFFASHNRTIGDPYGIGGHSTVATTGAWNWRRPGASWSAYSSIGYQQLRGSILTRAGSWSASAGVSKALSAGFVLSIQYGYSRFPAVAAGPISGDFIRKGIVLSVGWSPVFGR